MAVVINQLNDDQIQVNNKIVDKDTDGIWIARVELTTQEQKAFQKHINS